MRKVIVSEFISLDGVVQDPMWTFQFESEEQGPYKFNELKASDALLLGRVTYEGFATSWPNMVEQTGEYGEWMNDYPKYVVSTTLEEPLEWNNSRLIKENVAEEITKLKQQPGKDILVFGSADLTQTLMQHDLIDEYRLLVFPIILGGGQRLFNDESEKKVLKLIDTETFSSGVVVLTYQPASGS